LGSGLSNGATQNLTACDSQCIESAVLQQSGHVAISCRQKPIHLVQMYQPVTHGKGLGGLAENLSKWPGYIFKLLIELKNLMFLTG
jgi:hypothetical protein